MSVSYECTRDSWPIDIVVDILDAMGNHIESDVHALVDTAATYNVISERLRLRLPNFVLDGHPACSLIVNIQQVGRFSASAIYDEPVPDDVDFVIGRPLLRYLYLLIEGTRATLSAQQLAAKGPLLHTASFSISGEPYFRQVDFTPPDQATQHGIDLYTIHDTGARVSTLRPSSVGRLFLDNSLTPHQSGDGHWTTANLVVEKWTIQIPALRVRWRRIVDDPFQPPLLLGRPELNQVRMLWSGPAPEATRLQVFQL